MKQLFVPKRRVVQKVVQKEPYSMQKHVKKKEREAGQCYGDGRKENGGREEEDGDIHRGGNKCDVRCKVENSEDSDYC